jgi:hypothetical protein
MDGSVVLFAGAVELVADVDLGVNVQEMLKGHSRSSPFSQD